VIIFDSSFLVVLLQRDPPEAKDRENKPVSRFKERVESLAASLDVSNNPIGVPAPAMAEILVRAGKGRAQYITTLQDTWRFQILPFDSRAAIEAGDLIEKIKTAKEKWETWAKLKFDLQITAIAKAEAATLIYADDEDIERYAKRFNIPVKRICDLPLPPDPTQPEKPIESSPLGSQGVLALGTVKEDKSDGEKGASIQSGTPEPSNKLEADPAHPPSLQGSDSGRAQGETAGQETTGKS
jgi:predicted nucleic acid-binding protein